MAIRKPKRRTTVYETSLCRTVYGEEVEFNVTVDYDFEPGEREIKWGENACPGSDPFVTIDSVVVTSTGESIDLTDDETDTIREAIIEDKASDDGRDY